MDVKQIKALLHQQKLRLTKEREQLLELFAQSSTMLTPAQLHEHAQAAGLKTGLTTVYRLLETLTKVGAATPFLVDGTIYYAFCGCDHHHHFVCLSCHRIVELHDACPTFHVPEDFKVRSHRADLFGTCPDCQGSHAEQTQ